MADEKSGLRTLILPGILAILGTLFGGVLTGYLNAGLARDKYQSDLILRAMSPATEQERLATLRFMVDANIVTDGKIRDGIREIISRAKPDSLTVAPQIRAESAPALEAPVINNARIWLLSGRADDGGAIDSLKQSLSIAGFSVQGIRTKMIDINRPSTLEVRYFNTEDELQAQKMASFLAARKKISCPAKIYPDNSAKQGYIEIWLGK